MLKKCKNNILWVKGGGATGLFSRYGNLLRYSMLRDLYCFIAIALLLSFVRDGLAVFTCLLYLSKSNPLLAPILGKTRISIFQKCLTIFNHFHFVCFFPLSLSWATWPFSYARHMATFMAGINFLIPLPTNGTLLQVICSASLCRLWCWCSRRWSSSPVWTKH